MRPAATLVLSLALVACTGGGTPGSPSSPPASTAAPSPSGTESPGTVSPTPSARPIPPAWAAPIEQDAGPEDLQDEALIPPDAQLTARATLPASGGVTDGVAVAYVVGADPFASEHGFALWQRFDEAPAWSVVLAFVDPPGRGILGIRLEAGDLTGDGHDDVLTFEDIGGSGACGTWRVIAPSPGAAEQLFMRRTCDTEIRIADGDLEIRAAVYEATDPHCCLSAFRITTLRWNGSRWSQVSSELEPAQK